MSKPISKHDEILEKLRKLEEQFDPDDRAIPRTPYERASKNLNFIRMVLTTSKSPTTKSMFYVSNPTIAGPLQSGKTQKCRYFSWFFNLGP